MYWSAHRTKEAELTRAQTTIAVLAVVAVAALGVAFLRPGSAGAPGVQLEPGAGPADGGIVPPPEARTAPDTAGIRDPLALPERALQKLATSSLEDLSPEDRAAYDEYVSKAEATVRDNAASLKQTLERALKALTAGDTGALAAIAAADEGLSPEAVAQRRLAAQPKLVSGAPLPSVQIRTASTTTVYLAFAQVVWHDGGIDSEHTIAIPLRYTKDGWRLTTLDPLNDSGSLVVSQVTRLW